MNKKTAVITGGTGGLGKALDKGLRKRGWFTVLVDLPGTFEEQAANSPDSLFIAGDLTKRAVIEKVARQIRALRPSIDLVIYNAGITQIGAVSQTAVSSHRRVFEINYFAAVAMARELQADLRASRGVHLAISSVAGFSPLFHRAAYVGSKHALEGFFKTLRSEERDFGVDCLIAAPSFVATNIGNPQIRTDGIARPGSAPDGIDYMSPDKAADIIIEGLQRRKPFIPVGRIAWFSYLINRASPALLERLMDRKFKRT